MEGGDIAAFFLFLPRLCGDHQSRQKLGAIRGNKEYLREIVTWFT